MCTLKLLVFKILIFTCFSFLPTYEICIKMDQLWKEKIESTHNGYRSFVVYSKHQCLNLDFKNFGAKICRNWNDS